MKLRLNLRGPSRKAKYSLMTDSELSRATERWEEPRLGEASEPETITPTSGRSTIIRVTACLLHNDSASYRSWLG